MIIKRLVEGQGLPRSSSPLSQAVIAEGKFIFLSGQVGKHPETGVLADDFISQSRQAFENLKNVLALVGAQAKDVVRLMVFVTDLSKGQEFNRVYQEFFGEEFPTRTRVQVAALAPGYQVEVEAIAVLPE